jgi:uncharacterized protein
LMSEYARLSTVAQRPEPRYTMVTNGTRFTSAMAQSASRARMHVLVSIDGPASIHDMLRPTLGGKGSYLKASATVGLLTDSGVDVAIEAAYTREHFTRGITPQNLVEHYLSMGVRQFQIAPAVGDWHGVDTIAEMDQVGMLFEDAIRSSIHSFRSATPYLVRGIQFVLDSFALKERSRYVCGAGRTFMGINYDGEAFPCYLLQSPDVSYGFIDNRWDSTRYESVRHRFVQNGKEYHPVCRECWAHEICQSCLGTSWQISPQLTKPPAWFCRFQKRLIGAVLAEVASARQSPAWDTFLQNMSRHLAPLQGGHGN